MNEIVDTGFGDPAAVYIPGGEEESAPARPPITVAVNPPEPVGLTREGREAAKALIPLPKDFGTVQITALARDLAMDLLTVDVILKKHGLSNAQYEFLCEYNDYFKSTIAQQAKEWQSIGSTQDRLRAQAAAALEEQFPTLASRMGKQSEKFADAVEAAKLFAKVAGVDGTPSGHGAAGERFTINIDLGADTRLVIGAGADPQAGAGPAQLGGVRQDGGGQGARREVPALPKGSGPAEAV